MLISERQFYLLSERYKLSPTQRKLVRHMLCGVVRDHDVAPLLKSSARTIPVHWERIFKKMHLSARAEVLYRFVADAKTIRS